MAPRVLPPLSVVTPVYNGGAHIAETVASVLAQNYPDLDYVVVDDGSTDDTPARLASFSDRLRILRQENAGEAAAVNRGVAAAQHDIVGIVNADDPVLPGLLAAVGAAFAAEPSLVGVYPDWLKIDGAGRTIAEVRTPDFDRSVLVGQHCCIPGPGAFFRRSALAGEPVRDPALGTSGDYDFWLRLALRGEIRRIPRTLATWRLHPGGASAARCDADMARRMVDVVARFYGRPDVPADLRAIEDQAFSAAYFHAAMLAMRGGGIPAREFVLRSFWRKPRWPAGTLRQQRRSLPHILYILGQPWTGRAHALLGPLLPERFRREAVLGQRFGRRSDG